MFDKLQVEDESNVTVIEPTVIDNGSNGSNCESPQSIIGKKAERPSLRKLNNGVKSTVDDEWSSLSQFERLIKLEMENLTKDNLKKINATSVSTTAVKSNILKPEKHVSDALFLIQ